MSRIIFLKCKLCSVSVPSHAFGTKNTYFCPIQSNARSNTRRVIECFSSLVSWPPEFSCETWRRSNITVSTTLSSHQLYATSKSVDFINKELFCFWSRRHFLSEYKSNILSGTLLQYFGAAKLFIFNTDSLVST